MPTTVSQLPAIPLVKQKDGKWDMVLTTNVGSKMAQRVYKDRVKSIVKRVGVGVLEQAREIIRKRDGNSDPS